jgi:hypothetical protein
VRHFDRSAIPCGIHPPRRAEKSCAGDIKKYCKTVTPGEGHLIYCMQAHEDKISPKCAYDLEEAATSVETSAASLSEAISACKAEITGICGKIQPGQGRIAACLIANKSTASKNCAEAIQKIEALAAQWGALSSEKRLRPALALPQENHDS